MQFEFRSGTEVKNEGREAYLATGSLRVCVQSLRLR